MLLHSYYVCEKSDGMRYLLYCSKDTDGAEVTYLIDRRNDFWLVKDLHFPIPGDDTFRHFHTNTLIDGELVVDKVPHGHQQIDVKYLVFDCLVLDGNILMGRTLDKRLAYFKERVMGPYKEVYRRFPEEIQYLPFVIEMKQMQFSYHLEHMFRQILPNLPHGNDGLIFTCRESEYKHGTDPHILKWKPEAENSVDFRLSLEFPVCQPDELDRAEGVFEPYPDYDALPAATLLVHVGDREGDRPFASLHLLEKEWEAMKSLSVSQNQPLNDRIAECFMDPATKKWKFMRWRDDKEKPNHVSTVESVIESIEDGVSERELVGVSGRMKDAWKRRNQPGSATKEEKPQQGVKRKAEGEQGGARPSPGPGSGGGGS
jgi:mRNA guanylyltransferase